MSEIPIHIMQAAPANERTTILGKEKDHQILVQ
jgi:hypothetical protein